MQTSIHLPCQLLLCAALRPASAILLNEIHANPVASESTHEFIELVLEDSLAYDLRDLMISDGNATDLLLPRGPDTVLQPGALALILDSGYSGGYEIPAGTILLEVADASIGSGGLSNSSAEWISLLSAQGDTLDQVLTRPDITEGYSLERRQAYPACDSCWLPGNEFGGSPGRINSRAWRSYELQLELTQQRQLECLATGQSGFMGEISIEIGIMPCLHRERISLRNLEPGERQILSLPQPPLALLNPLSINSHDVLGERRVLLDTLILADEERAVFIEAVNLLEPQWIQLASTSACPLLLDGLRLQSRSLRLELEGTLESGGRVLLCRSGFDASCHPELELTASIHLALNEGLNLLDADSRILDLARWPEAIRSCWQRKHPDMDGGEESSWQAAVETRPGCEVQVQHMPESAWALSRKHFKSGEDLCVEPDGVQLENWTLEVWNLAGRRIWQDSGPRLLCWSGQNERETQVPAGLYLVRAFAGGRQQLLETVSFHP